jgi:hypothetical protein
VEVRLGYGSASTESHVPCLQERVDTGTVFCPVVVASQGSSLNHSA